jgi:(2Fe-2S) ferredoxin
MIEPDAARTVLVCCNVDCRERGSDDVLERLRARLDGDDRVEVREYLCFSACELGPNVVVVEDRAWYCGVGQDDVDAVVDEHLTGGRVVERLRPVGETLTENVIFGTLEAGFLPGEV